MNRDRSLSAAFVDLADNLGPGFDPVDLFDRLAAHSVRFTGAKDCGILIADGRGGLRVMAASSPDAELVELLQLYTGEGPCVECYRAGAPVDVPDLTAESDRWPLLVGPALAAGYRAAYTLPLRRHAECVGAVNLFFTASTAASDEDLHTVQALADIAALALVQWRGEPYRPLDLLLRLQTAINARAAVEQAKGLLAAHADIPLAVAAEALQAHAIAVGAPISTIARALVRRELRADQIIAAADGVSPLTLRDL